jgi:hypothetical protein
MQRHLGAIARSWKPAIASLSRRALDLVLPLAGLDGGAVQSPGLEADAWRKISFLADPVCDGCGQSDILIMAETLALTNVPTPGA